VGVASGVSSSAKAGARCGASEGCSRSPAVEGLISISSVTQFGCLGQVEVLQTVKLAKLA